MNIDIKTADGEEIELGGTYYDGRGTEYRPVGIRLVDYHRIAKVSLSCLTGKADKLCCVSMRPNELYSTPPDSWEKLEEDLDKGEDICDYYEECPKEMYGKSCSDCKKAALKNIASRIRKLRGEDE
jgi:hypothetical protein|nr:MAG TPA: hypothetical protein [Caudoviricetes sp.]